MRKTSILSIPLALCLFLPGCGRFHRRPEGVPYSAVWANGSFIDCVQEFEADKYHCAVYNGTTGEILAAGLFALSDPRPGDKGGLPYASFNTIRFDRFIELKDSRGLALVEASEHDPTIRLISNKLKSISSPNNMPATDCGVTSMGNPDEKTSQCAKSAFENRKAFQIRYTVSGAIPRTSFGLAGDANGNVYEVLYNMNGLLGLGLRKNEMSFDDGHVRVTSCIKPIILGKTQEGLLACVTPINEKESALAAQQEPIDTSVCSVVENPAAFNNKMVRIHGHVSGNFEYSLLDGDECSGSLWFDFGYGSGAPPGLVAHVPGGAEPGAEDSEGQIILPIPVRLIRDSHFNGFQSLMNARVAADKRSDKSDPSKFVIHCVTATFTGRIDGVSSDIHGFHLRRKPTDQADYLGFGQMGLFDAQLVVQSIENDAALGVCPQDPG